MNNLNLRTPRILEEAVEDVLCFRPTDKSYKDHGYDTIKDFIAQKVTVALAKAEGNKQATEILLDLFKQLTKREL